MSQDTEKYLYFKVGLLKDSYALEALWQDALRYHMIDQPAQLIALRLTEYYELMKKDSAHSTANAATTLATLTERETKEGIDLSISSLPATSLAAYQPLVHSAISHSSVNTNITTDQGDEIRAESDRSLTLSAGVDQNAEDAADYWSLL